MTATVVTWDWRKACGGIWLGDDRWVDDPTAHDGRRVERVFHAYDVNNSAACEPICGLGMSCEDVNEGSTLCTGCIEVVRAEPSGRPRRIARNVEEP